MTHRSSVDRGCLRNPLYQHVNLITFAGALASVALALAAPAYAQEQHDVYYRLTQIGAPDEDATLSFAHVTDINDRGELVGTYWRRSGDQTRGFLWRNGEVIDLGSLDGDRPSSVTEPTAISERSEVVGQASDENGTMRAFVWHRGYIESVALPESHWASATDINVRGQIIGTDVAEQRPFVASSHGAVTYLPNLPGTDFSYVNAINARGQIIGSGEIVATASDRPVLWQDGTPIDLGAADPGGNFSAIDINDRGQIVGVGSFRGSGGVLLWQAGKFTMLPQLYPQEGANSRPYALNERTQVVGTTQALSTHRDVATLWSDGRAIDLNQRIRSDDPLQPYVNLEYAIRINNRGQIVAFGIDSRVFTTIYYLLTPER